MGLRADLWQKLLFELSGVNAWVVRTPLELRQNFVRIPFWPLAKLEAPQRVFSMQSGRKAFYLGNAF